MIKLFTILLALFICTLAIRLDSDRFIDIPFKELIPSDERIKAHGYPAESHYVETEDNYVLNIFRIPYSPRLQNEATPNKPVVLFMHGTLSCSDCFLLNGPDNAIAFNFVDQGYDVWLGNARGNLYSRNNTRITIKHPHFYRFSWHEIGAIDLPATIDYILDLTGHSSLHFVGHSQGCTVFFVMASFRPEYNAKIRTSQMLAPSVFNGNSTSYIHTSTASWLGHHTWQKALLENQVFLPQNNLIQRTLDTLCSNKPIQLELCKTLFLSSDDGDFGNRNVTLMSQVAETHPAGTSTNVIIHYTQIHATNRFCQYDWGVRGNLREYNQEDPPSYDLTKITTDMYLYYGLADLASGANKADVLRLLDLLPNIKLFYEVPDETWGHVDFIFAMQVKEEINDRVIAACIEYDRLNSSK